LAEAREFVELHRAAETMAEFQGLLLVGQAFSLSPLTFVELEKVKSDRL
jgi:hypothetical protein